MIDIATMSSVCPDWNMSKIIDSMKNYGYKGFEPRVEWGHACGIELDLSSVQRNQLRNRMEDSELEICCIATGVKMAEPDLNERAKHLDSLKHYIDLAADLGCTRLRTFGGQRARDIEWPAIVDYVVEGFMEVLSLARARDVKILLETHDEWSCSAPVRSVIEQIGSEYIRVLWDFMHTQRMLETSNESFNCLGSHVEHVHVHDGDYLDGKMRVGLLGDGVIDHQTPLDLLSKSGFSGYVSVEVIHKPDSSHNADAVLLQYAERLRSMINKKSV